MAQSGVTGVLAAVVALDLVLMPTSRECYAVVLVAAAELAWVTGVQALVLVGKA